MSILYTAKKYAVPALEAACVNFLEKCANGENAFMLFSKARLYDEKLLAEYCFKIIDENAQDALNSEDFLGIDHETLCMVLARDTLRAKEMTLFNAAIRWALHACQIQNLPPTPDNQRLILGSVLHLIRFPLMSQTDFAKHVVPSKLLLVSEIISVFLYHHTGPEHPPMPFSSNYRKLPEMVVKRFRQVRSGRWSASRRIFDSIKYLRFEVDTPVCILGLGLYGSDQGCCQYSVLIKISNSNTGELLASNECSFLSNGTPATFRVMFEKPVEISPNTTYLTSSKLTVIEDGLHKIKMERNGLPRARALSKKCHNAHYPKNAITQI